LRALTHAIGEADQFLLALRCRTNNHKNALRLILKPRFPRSILFEPQQRLFYRPN
jgi:hypothetical protein